MNAKELRIGDFIFHCEKFARVESLTIDEVGIIKEGDQWATPIPFLVFSKEEDKMVPNPDLTHVPLVLFDKHFGIEGISNRVRSYAKRWTIGHRGGATTMCEFQDYLRRVHKSELLVRRF